MRSISGGSALLMFSGGMLLSSGIAQAEDVSLATYYASPRGDYEEMRVYDNALLALEGGQVGIGTGSRDIRAMLDVHGEAAATVLGLAKDDSGRAQTWWLGSFSGDDFGWEQWDSMRGNYEAGSSPPKLGGATHPSMLITHAGGYVGIGDFSLLPLPGGGTGPRLPVNRLEINGAVVVGAALAGVATGPSNGLLVQGKTGISLKPGDKAKNELDVGGKAVIGSSYVGSATPPDNSLLVEGQVGVGVPPGTALANKLEVGGPAVIGEAYAGVEDVSTASGTFTANLGIQGESRTTKMIKAPDTDNSGDPIYPKAWMGGGGSVGGDWAFGVLDRQATAGAITDGEESSLQVCSGDCLGLGGGVRPQTTVFSASSAGVVSITNSPNSVDTLKLDTTTTPKLVALQSGASLKIENGAAENSVFAAEDATGKGVWLVPTTSGLQGNAGASPLPTTASRPEALLFFGTSGCNSPNRLELLFEADSGSLSGCVGTAP